MWYKKENGIKPTYLSIAMVQVFCEEQNQLKEMNIMTRMKIKEWEWKIN